MVKSVSKNIEIINEIEALLLQLKASLGEGPTKGVKKGRIKKLPSEFSGLTAELFKLVQEGFFKEPNRRRISEIKNKLHQRAVNKPTTSLMKPLRLLIWKGILDREKPGGKGNYEYFEAK
jgi:hypothetical protein